MRVVILFIGILFLSEGYSQVTIGSDSSPMDGCILQLKNINEVTQGGENANKGLGLPRVKLTQVDKLYPMFINKDGTENAVYNTQSKKEEVNSKHAGLMVYNVNKVETATNRICPGIHVWDGSKWQSLTPYPKYPSLIEIIQKENPPATFIDERVNDAGVVVESETYNIAWFGLLNYKGGYDLTGYNPYACENNMEIPTVEDGDYWFTENLRTKYYLDPNSSNGKTIRKKIDLVPESGRNSNLGYYGYPHTSKTTNDEIFVSHKYYGLLYNWKAIVDYEINSANISSNESFTKNAEITGFDGAIYKVVAGSLNPFIIPIQDYEVEKKLETAPNLNNGQRQGLCPKGWHVPSQREWYQVLYNMTIGGQSYIEEDVILSEGNKKNTAWIMGAREQIYQSSYSPNTNFSSKHFSNNGYYALLTGYGSTGNSSMVDYGYSTWIWSSSSSSSIFARDFMFRKTDTSISHFDDNKNYLLPVRCAKDKK